jgi:hypothetical protein
MARNVIGVAFLIAFLLGCVAEGLAQKLHPRLKKKEVGLKSLLLIPPRVTIARLAHRAVGRLPLPVDQP